MTVSLLRPSLLVLLILGSPLGSAVPAPETAPEITLVVQGRPARVALPQSKAAGTTLWTQDRDHRAALKAAWDAAYQGLHPPHQASTGSTQEARQHQAWTQDLRKAEQAFQNLQAASKPLAGADVVLEPGSRWYLSWTANAGPVLTVTDPASGLQTVLLLPAGAKALQRADHNLPDSQVKVDGLTVTLTF